MKLKSNFRSALFMLMLGFVVTFSACKKKDPDANDNATEEQASARDNSQTESDIDASTDLESRALEQLSMARPVNGSGTELETVPFLPGGTCADITSVTANNVRTITIDFGSTGCVGVDGRTRKGKIILTFEAPNNTSGNPFYIVGRTMTATFDNHYVGLNPLALVKVEGTKKVTCKAFVNPTPNMPGVLASRRDSIVVTGAKLTFPDNTTHTWESTRIRTFTANSFTWATNADSRVLRVWGTYSGKNRNDVNYTGTVAESEKLVWKGSCAVNVYRPIGGKLTLTRTANGTTRTALVDYGTETCDNTFTVTINGQTYTVN